MTRYDEFQALRDGGANNAEIARQFGVSRQWVWIVLDVRGEPSAAGRKASATMRRRQSLPTDKPAKGMQP